MNDNPFPNAVLLRVGLDNDLGGIWAPVTDHAELDEKREFEYIPFPEWQSKTKTRGRPETELNEYGVRLWTYGELPATNHPGKNLSDYLPYDRIKCQDEYWFQPSDVVPHNDPNFRYATSGEYWRGTKRADGTTHGRLPVAWKYINPEDQELWLFFVERLAPFEPRPDFVTLQRQQKLGNGLYIIGALLVKEFVNIATTDWESALENHSQNKSAIVENFHFRRRNDAPVVVIGSSNKTQLIPKALPLNFVREGRRGVTEAGKLLGVTEKDQVRFKYLYYRDTVEKLLDILEG